MTFIEDVAQAIKEVPDVSHVGIAFPIDGPELQTIVVNTSDDLWVIEVTKVNPL
jgi:hypothetical protein